MCLEFEEKNNLKGNSMVVHQSPGPGISLIFRKKCKTEVAARIEGSSPVQEMPRFRGYLLFRHNPNLPAWCVPGHCDCSPLPHGGADGREPEKRPRSSTRTTWI